MAARKIKTKTIKQKVKFDVSPNDVFDALMDSRKHSQFTESSARISRQVGGRISVYDGYIEGTNLEIVPDKKIVQKWRASDWPKGHFSVAKFELKKKGRGSELMFTQESVPVEQYKAISDGWHEHYWNKMKEFFKKKRGRLISKSLR